MNGTIKTNEASNTNETNTQMTQAKQTNEKKK